MEIKRALGIPGTLLGVDVYFAPGRFELDVTAAWLEAHVDSAWRLIVSFGRGQGILFGRGNQQLTAKVLGLLDRSQIQVVATRTKLASLNGRPLLVDTNDVAVDTLLTGLIEITAGYEDVLLYRIASDLDPSDTTADTD